MLREVSKYTFIAFIKFKASRLKTWSLKFRSLDPSALISRSPCSRPDGVASLLSPSSLGVVTQRKSETVARETLGPAPHREQRAHCHIVSDSS